MRLELKFKIKQIQLDIELAHMGGKIHKLRDLIDPAEGYLRGIVNSKDNYNHQYMKMNCTTKSVKAVELLKKLEEEGIPSKKWGSYFHREHAIPMAVNQPKLMSMVDASVEEIANFIDKQIISVLITKEEAEKLDSKGGLKDKMPEEWNGNDPFARFANKNIELAK